MYTCLDLRFLISKLSHKLRLAGFSFLPEIELNILKLLRFSRPLESKN